MGSKPRKRAILLCALASLSCVSAEASDTNFAFTLPSFGGSGLNSSYYLNLLEQQKGDFSSGQEKTDIEVFEEQLRRRMLSAIASNIVSDIYGTDSTTPSEGEVDVGDLNIVYEKRVDQDQFCVTITDVFLNSTTETCVPLQ